MTPTQRKAMELVLEKLKAIASGEDYGKLTPVIDAVGAALAEQPAEQEPVAQRWQPIETAPKGRIVLVYYKNSLGNGRTMRARYYLPETLDSDTTESGWADEGWYEESEAYEYLMPLEHDPTHWMPLPAGPDTAPQPAIPPGYKPERPLTDEMALTLAKFAGMKFSPAQFSGVLECETDEFTLATFARLVLGFAAAPEAPQPAKRVPLTDEELRDALRSCPHDAVENLRVRWLYAKDFARAVERAHGIGETK